MILIERENMHNERVSYLSNLKECNEKLVSFAYL
jgi:hypothetical protein